MAKQSNKSSKTAKSVKTKQTAPLDFDKLDTAWSHTDGEGYVRVIPTDNYRTGFVVIASVGPLAEKADYFPEMTLARDKVTIAIEDTDTDKALALAAAIDTVLNGSAVKG